MSKFKSTARNIHGFTLIELLVVVAIISLLVSILLPSLTKAKELAKTVVCMSNLRGMTTGALVYENEEEFLPPHRYCTINGSSDEESRWEYQANKGCNPTSDNVSVAQNFFPKLFADILVDRDLAGVDIFDCPSKSNEGNVGTAADDWNGKTSDNVFNYAVNGRLNGDSGAVVSKVKGLSSWGNPAALSLIQEDLSQAMFYADSEPGLQCTYELVYWGGSHHNSGTVRNYSFFDGHAETWNPAANPEMFGWSTQEVDYERGRQFWLWYTVGQSSNWNHF